MYFDLSYIRSFLATAIKLLLIVGIIAILLGAILSFVSLPDFTDGSSFERLFTGLKYVSFQIFSSGLVLIACALIGVLSTQINNDITVGLFAMSTVFVFLSLLVFSLAFAGLVIATQSVSLNSQVCLNSPLFQTPQRLFAKGSRYFGSKYCKVKLDNPSIYANDAAFKEAEILVDQENGYTSVQQCPHYNDMLADLNMSKNDSYDEYIGSLETAFQCSGICSSHPIYVFSDVQRGKPAQSKGCFIAVSEYISVYGWPILVVLWAVTCLVMLLALNSLCLFAHPRRYDDLYLYHPVEEDSIDKLNDSTHSAEKGENSLFQLSLNAASNQIQRRRSTQENEIVSPDIITAGAVEEMISSLDVESSRNSKGEEKKQQIKD